MFYLDCSSQLENLLLATEKSPLLVASPPTTTTLSARAKPAIHHLLSRLTLLVRASRLLQAGAGNSSIGFLFAQRG